jgi:ribosomal protein S18 acetylase RimI-like enzyme
MHHGLEGRKRMYNKMLSDVEIDLVLEKIERKKEQHLVLYSYLTVRRKRVIFYGQVFENRMVGVVGYLSGMPFTALALYIEKSGDLESLLSFVKKELKFGLSEVGTTILDDEQLKFLQDHGKVVHGRRNVLMKHVYQHALVDDYEVVSLEGKHSIEVNQLAKDVKMIAFSNEEIISMPHVGIFKENRLVAMAGFHVYDECLVEIGNIGTIEEERGNGYGKIVSSAVTRIGKQKCDNVYLYVFIENVPALKTYEAIGYETVAYCNFVEFAF